MQRLLWGCHGVRFLLVLTALGCCVFLESTLGCGWGESSAGGVAVTSTSGSTGTVGLSIHSVFQAVKDEIAPVTVYEPTYLPLGAAVAASWVPLTEISSPQTSTNAAAPNPRIDVVSGSAEVVLACGSGWLGIIENYRGDLGDTQGKSVGAVAGHDAYLYSQDGTSVVQWSDGGRWYAVIGRDISAEEVTKVALGMRAVG